MSSSAASGDAGREQSGRADKSKRSGLTTRSRASAKSSASKVAARYAGQVCALCQDDTIAAEHKWKKSVFHAKPCWTKIRNRQQQLMKIPGALAKDAELFDSDKDAWRADNLPHASDDKEVRKKARMADKKKYRMKVKVKGEYKVRPVLHLKKRHYKGWKKQWEGMDSDEASANFDVDYDKQGLVKCFPLYG